MIKKGLIFGALFFCALLFTGCSSSSDKKLHIYVWADYIKPSLIQRFEKENQCKVIVDTYDSNEAMYAKLAVGASGYDLLFPSNYFLDLMTDQQMLQALDLEKIPNRKYLDQKYLVFARGTKENYSMPYSFTFTGVAFRKDKVKDIGQSWNVFGRTDLKGRMTMLNDIREVFGAALVYLGYNVNTTNSEEIQKAKEQIIAWKRNLAKFESEQYKNGIASAEYLASQGYSGDVLQVMRENNEVGFYIPEEGGLLSCDYMVIPKMASNPELATLFINFMLEPAVAAENMEFTQFMSPNMGAYEKLSPETLNNPIMFPSESVLKKAQVIENIGNAIREYNKAWDEIKAAR